MKSYEAVKYDAKLQPGISWVFGVSGIVSDMAGQKRLRWFSDDENFKKWKSDDVHGCRCAERYGSIHKVALDASVPGRGFQEDKVKRERHLMLV
jgi:hypothetical protein